MVSPFHRCGISLTARSRGLLHSSSANVVKRWIDIHARDDNGGVRKSAAQHVGVGPCCRLAAWLFWPAAGIIPKRRGGSKTVTLGCC